MDAGEAGPDAPPDAGPSPILDPKAITKFVDPLVIPPAMPFESQAGGVTSYQVSVRQFHQQVLPTGMPKTTVWGYGRDGDPLPDEGLATTYNYPGFTFDLRSGQKVRVKWINRLVDGAGQFLEHLYLVDGTLHWADPFHGTEDEAATPYRGPVPLTVHVHGAHVADHSDGHPDSWFLPSATNLPVGAMKRGMGYHSVVAAEDGAAVFEYTNDQPASTLWYHDHALGITRLNVWAGLAGFWLLRDDVEDGLGLPGPAPALGDPAGTRYYEIPIAIQDRTFRQDGSFYYPGSRKDFDGYEGPYVPETNVHPIWNPEFFGNVMVVNGRAWPVLEVEPRLYRLRLLNGCDSRFLVLHFDNAGITFHQIGAEGGLISGAPAVRSELLIAPGERADVIVDFASMTPGQETVLLNTGPDEPYNGVAPQDPADPETTGQVMKFKVVAASGQGIPGAIPTQLPVVAPLTTTLSPRDVTLNEVMYHPADIPAEALLGTTEGGPLEWGAAITETPFRDTTEIWRILNLTADAHPIHLHLVSFQVLDRTPFKSEEYAAAQRKWLDGQGGKPVIEDYLDGAPEPAWAWESGFKDTVVTRPGNLTRIIAKFDLEGSYVWHCHILSHEDNEMMRPLQVLPPP
ncbi:MAG: multicopper oxidase domain-containing protein [Deltaproteobacteria bacterium]|nr:multicopper oxidase domain-containing protein [Deltaproteobacteria bacterium]